MSSWVAIDFETANSFRGSPCAVGLVRVKEGEIVEEWSTLIRPPDGHGRFDPMNVAIHGITAARVADAPPWQRVLGQITEFAAGDPFVAHNAAFDVGVLADACRASGSAVPDLEYACTLVVARRVWDGMLSYKLPVLAGVLGIEPARHHDAAADARAAAEVMLAALRRHGTSELDRLLGAHRVQMGSYRGGNRRACKHRGPVRKPPPGADPDADPDNPFYGRTVCFTGTINGMTRPVAEQRIAALGAQAVRDVTTSVDLLVVGEIDFRRLAPGAAKTGKLAKAERYRNDGHGITVIDAEEFRELLAAWT
ncbi:exonuclease domain-containing protein [Spirillospora sp. NPDC052242]